MNGRTRAGRGRERERRGSGRSPRPRGRFGGGVAATCDVMVNGPEGEDLDWDAIDWRNVEANVRRLRQRIFTASQAGDLKQVRNLQKLMLRSRSREVPALFRRTCTTRRR